MELDELIPERVEWKPTLKVEGKEDKELELAFRPFNLEDESWLKRTYGDAKLQEIFETLQMGEIVKIAFRQLEISSKRALMEIKFLDVDEDGKDIEIAPKGPDKLGCLVHGYPEQLELMKMLLRTRGVSMPILEELGKRILEEHQKDAATT